MRTAPLWLLPLVLLTAGCRPAPGRHSPPTPARSPEDGPAALSPPLDQRIEALVSQLSSDSIELRDHWGAVFGLRSAEARRLVWVGRPATARLLSALRDVDRGVAAHVILTAIWQPEKCSRSGGLGPDGVAFRCKETFTGGVHPTLSYEFNGLRWTQGPKTLSVAEDDLAAVAERWRKTVAASPVTEEDYRDAESRWAAEIARIVPLLPRYGRTP